MQSHEGFIHLLPALPKEWLSGEVKGLVARGSFVVDIKWNEGKLTEATILSKLGGNCQLKMNGNAVCREAELKETSGKNTNRLPQQPAEVTFRNISKTSPVELPVAVGKIYEMQTERI